MRDSVADTWAWMRTSPRLPLPEMAGRTPPGLPADLEARLLAGR